MQYKRIFLWIFFLLFCYSLRAQDAGEMKIRATGTILPDEYLYLVGGDLNVEKHGESTRFILADSSYIDLYYYEGDSVLLIRSQCAPLCASFARVYDEDWRLLRAIETPRTMILPEAYVQDGQLRWRDNYRDDESPK